MCEESTVNAKDCLRELVGMQFFKQEPFSSHDENDKKPVQISRLEGACFPFREQAHDIDIKSEVSLEDCKPVLKELVAVAPDTLQEGRALPEVKTEPDAHFSDIDTNHDSTSLQPQYENEIEETDSFRDIFQEDITIYSHTLSPGDEELQRQNAHEEYASPIATEVRFPETAENNLRGKRHKSASCLFEETHFCDLCGKSFGRKCHLIRHMINHMHKQPCVCDVCGLTFSRTDSLRRHRAIHVTGGTHRSHICDVCGKGFSHRYNLKRHCVVHGNQKAYICDRCGKTFTQLGDMKKHATVHTGRELQKCDTCGRSFQKRTSLVRHQLCAGDGLPAQVCQQCVHQVNNYYNFKLQCEKSDLILQQYLNSEQSENQPFQDPANGCFEIDIKPNLETDMKPNLSTSGDGINVSQQMEECSTTGKKLSSQMKSIKMSAQHSNGTKGWRQHGSQLCKNLSQDCISAVDEPTETAIHISFPCNVCGKSFKRKANLNEHITRHIGRRPHICEICGKRFTERSSLKKHALSHTGLKMHVCDMCGKRFLLLSHLKAHALIHSGQKLHVCDVCGKRFTQLGNLRTHALLHTGEKPFSCNLCGRSFAQKNTLKIHIRTHTGQKPYVCSICSKSFSQRAQLKAHTISHSGEKRFCCDICGTSFARKHSLKKHVARHGDH